MLLARPYEHLSVLSSLVAMLAVCELKTWHDGCGNHDGRSARKRRPVLAGTPRPLTPPRPCIMASEAFKGRNYKGILKITIHVDFQGDARSHILQVDFKLTNVLLEFITFRSVSVFNSTFLASCC